MPKGSGRQWLLEAVRRIEADYNRSADTHLIRVELPRHRGITLYLKDESSHPTGSLKHRLARSLFLYALCNEWITARRPIFYTHYCGRYRCMAGPRPGSGEWRHAEILGAAHRI